MIPKISQYKKWTLPSKISFWAGFLGIPIGLISLILTVLSLNFNQSTDNWQTELNQKSINSFLQAAQELRYNKHWLSELSTAFENRLETLPPGSMKVDALNELIKKEYQRIIAHSYGEEKHLYQEVLKFCDHSKSLGNPSSLKEISNFNKRSNYSLHDMAFFNDFIFWYLSPTIQEILPNNLLMTFCWNQLPNCCNHLPNQAFTIKDVKKLKLKYFTSEGKPITEFVNYLGLID